MIVDKKISVYRTAVGMKRPLLLIFLWAIVVALIHWHFPKGLVWLSPLPLTIAGVALGVLLAFRNNAGYDRYWEGRKLWGSLVNSSRSFARQADSFLNPAATNAPRDLEGVDGVLLEEGERKAFLRDVTYRVIAYAHALRHHLRREDPFPDLVDLMPPDEIARLRRVQNVPSNVLILIGEQLTVAYRRGWLDSILLSAIDQTLTDIANVQGGCERIRNTPLPPTYNIIGHQIIRIFCVCLPFGLVRDLGPLMPLSVVVIAFAFLLISRISMLLEDPFGLLPNDLPLTTLSRVIEIDLRDALGEDNVPKPLQPVNGVLL